MQLSLFLEEEVLPTLIPEKRARLDELLKANAHVANGSHTKRSHTGGAAEAIWHLKNGKYLRSVFP